MRYFSLIWQKFFIDFHFFKFDGSYLQIDCLFLILLTVPKGKKKYKFSTLLPIPIFFKLYFAFFFSTILVLKTSSFFFFLLQPLLFAFSCQIFLFNATLPQPFLVHSPGLRVCPLSSIYWLVN